MTESNDTVAAAAATNGGGLGNSKRLNDGQREEEVNPCYYSSDEELMQEEEVDPFRHRIKMSKFQWAWTYVLGAVLVPLRLVSIVVIVLLAWVSAKITLMGVSDEYLQTTPLRGWRKYGKNFAEFMGRLACMACGLLSVEVRGERADPSEAPVLVCAPHSTYFDGLVVFWSGLPYVVSRAENQKLPFIGRLVALSQAISVKREDRNSRHNTVQEIIRRTGLHQAPDPEDRWPQLVIFPEGSCSNRKALMTFKPGAFIPGKPVQPVLVRYPNKIDTVTWTWNQPHGSKSVMFTTMAQPYTKAVLEYLPVYRPSQEEVDDPKLYANNVRQLMAKALQVPTTELTFEEVKAKYAAFYKKKNVDKKEK